MAICKLNKNFLRSNTCGYSLPEVTDIYLINNEDISAVTVTEGTGDTLGCDEIATITLKTGAKAYHIEPAKDSTDFSDNLATGSTGNKYREQSVTFSINGKYDSCMHGGLDALALGRFLAIVKTAEGGYIALGRVAPLEASVANVAGGSDANGVTVTLTGNQAESALPLSDEAVTSLLSNIAV